MLPGVYTLTSWTTGERSNLIPLADDIAQSYVGIFNPSIQNKATGESLEIIP